MKRNTLLIFCILLPIISLLFSIICWRNLQQVKANNQLREYAINLFFSGKYELASDLFKHLVSKGDHVSSFYLGRMYLEGINADKNKHVALIYLAQAAKGGHVIAQNDLSILLREEPFKNEIEALYWLKKAAQQNYPPALVNLSTLYLTGNLVEKDEEHGIFLLEKAAKQGYSMAQIRLAFLYFEGKATKQDIGKGLHYLKKAAVYGDAHAQYLLGVIYFLFNDDIQSHDYLKKAVLQDNPQALLFLMVIAEERDEFKLEELCRKRLIRTTKLSEDQLQHTKKMVMELYEAKKLINIKDEPDNRNKLIDIFVKNCSLGE